MKTPAGTKNYVFRTASGEYVGMYHDTEADCLREARPYGRGSVVVVELVVDEDGFRQWVPVS